MFAISPTDKAWFDLLKKNQFNSFVNFWTPTPWNIKSPRLNDKWYFLLKSPIRKIGGYGELVKYENLTPVEAWKYYGVRNGCENIETFEKKIQSYIDRNSIKFGNNTIDINTYKIGCIILKNCQFWDEEDYLSIEDFNISVPSQVVTRKVFNIYDPFIHNLRSKGFQLLNDPRANYRGEVNLRKGQGKFKGIVLKAYNNKCCISGETCPELLEAAHLQEYLNEDSNHAQNGILLRVDLHRLFDNGLLYIDREYIIHISSLLKSSMYHQYDGLKINLPEDEFNYPSIEALERKESNFRS